LPTSRQESHQIATTRSTFLCNLEHRGAVGADRAPGDGAGILVQIPHAFFKRKAAEMASSCRSPATTPSAQCSLPKETAGAK